MEHNVSFYALPRQPPDIHRIYTRSRQADAIVRIFSVCFQTLFSPSIASAMFRGANCQVSIANTGRTPKVSERFRGASRLTTLRLTAANYIDLCLGLPATINQSESPILNWPIGDVVNRVPPAFQSKEMAAFSRLNSWATLLDFLM